MIWNNFKTMFLLLYITTISANRTKQRRHSKQKRVSRDTLWKSWFPTGNQSASLQRSHQNMRTLPIQTGLGKVEGEDPNGSTRIWCKARNWTTWRTEAGKTPSSWWFPSILIFLPPSNKITFYSNWRGDWTKLDQRQCSACLQNVQLGLLPY